MKKRHWITALLLAALLPRPWEDLPPWRRKQRRS